jgi:Zn-dependent metalloprotease
MAQRRVRSSSSHRCTILPAYVLQQVALNAGQAQRQAALTTMLLDEGFRSRRLASSLVQTSLRRRSPMGFGALSAEGGQRSIHDAENTLQLPGKLVRSEGQAAGPDVAVNEAYDGLGATYALYAEQYDRDSIDDQGMPLSGSVHYDVKYDNAFWDGTQMVFGDGDGDLFNRFTISLDVIGHELTHGVTEKEAGLVYMRQPGALNESISDVFGSLVKQYESQTTAEDADWLIGEGLLGASVQGVALRSMKAPGTAYDDPNLGKDPQPATMDGYVVTSQDNGGVHINSGIPNHAFYLAAVEIGGYAWEKAGRIWYETLRSPRMFPRLGFRGFATLTSQTAARLYGRQSSEAMAVRDAWKAVGLARSGVAGRRAQQYPAARQLAAHGASTTLMSPWFAEAGGEGHDATDGTSRARVAAKQSGAGQSRRKRTAKKP